MNKIFKVKPGDIKKTRLFFNTASLKRANFIGVVLVGMTNKILAIIQ